MVQALQMGPRSTSDGVTAEIWQLIEHLFPADRAHLTIQWIPGHCGLEGNEAADGLAGGASNVIGQQHVPVDFSSAKAAVKRRTRKRWKQSISHVYYGHKRQASKTAKTELSVAEERILSQFRCNGHCPLLQTYKARIGVDPSAVCPSCRTEDETAEHCLLRCPATEHARTQLLGHQPTLSILWEDPQKLIEFLRSIGRLGGHRQRL
ncbi:reverse transcriptase [Aphelenchoides avenae]|nr:reverse transcriptase [Aphelenchus avenae]